MAERFDVIVIESDRAGRAGMKMPRAYGQLTVPRVARGAGRTGYARIAA